MNGALEKLSFLIELQGSEKFKKDIETVRNSVEKDTKSMKQSFTDFAGSTKVAFAAVGAAIVAVVGVAFSLAKEVANLGDSMDEMSQRTGVSVENLSAFSYAAERCGTNIDALEAGLRKLSKNAYDASNGTGEAKDSFDRLGVSVLDVEGNLKAADVLFLEVADRIKAMDNATEAAAVTQEIFGRGATALVPLLKEGSDGIEEMRRQARELGVELSEDFAKDSAKFNDALQDATAAITGVKVAIGKELIPAFTALIDDAITPSIKKIRELIQDLKDAKKFSEDLKNSSPINFSGPQDRFAPIDPNDPYGRFASTYPEDAAQMSNPVRGSTIGNRPTMYTPTFGSKRSLSQILRNPALGVVSDEELNEVRKSVREQVQAAQNRTAEIKRDARLSIAEEEINRQLFGSYGNVGDKPSARGVVTGQTVGAKGNPVEIHLEPVVDLKEVKDEFSNLPTDMEKGFEDSLQRIEATMMAFGLRGRGIFGNIANMRAGAMGLGVGVGDGATGQLARTLLDVAGQFGAAGQFISGAVGIFQGIASLFGGTKVSGDFAGMSTEELQNIAKGDLGKYAGFQKVGDEAVQMFRQKAQSELDSRGVDPAQGSQTFSTQVTVTEASFRAQTAIISSILAELQNGHLLVIADNTTIMANAVRRSGGTALASDTIRSQGNQGL